MDRLQKVLLVVFSGVEALTIADAWMAHSRGMRILYAVCAAINLVTCGMLLWLILKRTR